MRKMIDYLIGTKETRGRLLGAFLSACILGGAYYMINREPVGWFTYALMVPPSIIILLTSIARVNDMGVGSLDWRGHLRKLGFIMSGTAAVAFLSVPFSINTYWPTWKAVMLAYGVAAAWFTTPNMIPWWRYISGEFRQKDLEKLSKGEKPSVIKK